MFCRNCGTENDAEAKFCKSCGQPLTQGQPENTSAAAGETENVQSAEGACQGDRTGSYQGGQGGQGSQGSQGTQNNANSGQNRSMYKYNYNSGDSDATVALVLGIISMVMCSSSLLGIGLGIFAIVMANKAKKQGSTSGNIAAGQVCGIIGICLSGLATIYYIFAFLFGLASALN